MNINVDFEELDKVTNTMVDDKTALEIEIDNLLESLERIKLCWHGDDLEHFYSKAFEYISRMKVLTEYMDTTSNFIKKSNISYQEQDRQFSEDLNKEAELLDEQRLHQYDGIREGD